MTKREFKRRQTQAATLQQLGFTEWEADQLRRISMTLHRWHELECGNGLGAIERLGEDKAPYWHNATSRYLDSNDPRAYHRVPDREKGAIKRLDRIVANRNLREGALVARIKYYIQTDPRGCALYILRPGDVPIGANVESCYTRGLAVY